MTGVSASSSLNEAVPPRDIDAPPPQRIDGVEAAALVAAGSHVHRSRRPAQDMLVETQLVDVPPQPPPEFTANVTSVDQAGRIERLKSLIAWYQSRLGSNPDSSNTELWKQEIVHLESELEEMTRGRSTRGDSIDAEFLGKITSIWASLVQSSVVTLKKNNKLRRDSAGSTAEADSGPWTNNPIALLHESNKRLDSLLSQVEEFASTSEGWGRPNPVLASKQENGNKAALMGENNTSEIFTGLLRENMLLRAEINEYQRGVIERTQAKQTFFEQQRKSPLLTQPNPTQNSPKGTLAPSSSSLFNFLL